ncbi:alpha/beta hydrolase [Mycobacteroides chelonae]|uniref:Esterase n=1 Tax=Mycobacteroides chelonae TaxID=1774 RepID=A0A1S1MBG1_MYCCH|nr:alpha/beta hydrolase [Mycobacteroides chelonae]OHU53771.1 esterase [Mycobacteroides chelonae]OHU80556.1 esterase [Mycobacteroides chelonae]QQG86618.1 alpha/beta hydrolase [Mycobacteroides chelonae]QQG91435.1 alpha/beta hydrolase [Mycobacteroides chelonae]
MASPDNVPSPVISVELPRRASRRLRLAHVLLGLTVRPLGDLAVWTQRHRLLPKALALWVTTRADRLLIVLPPPRGTKLQRNDFPDFRAEWVWDPAVANAPEAATGAVLYFHGGALLSCGLNSHRRIVARMSTATGLPVYNVEYRQIPEAHITQTVDDCVRAYRRLLEIGISPDRIVLAGDSAGGGLVFSTALAIRDRALPTPAALVTIAPFANYDSTARLQHPNNKIDPALSAGVLALPVTWGMQVNGRLNPTWSPVNHDFKGLPPTLIQVGSTEVLLADAYEVAARCVEAGVPLRFQLWDHALHVFHAGADVLPDARQAFSEIGKFVREVLGEAQCADSTTTLTIVGTTPA